VQPSLIVNLAILDQGIRFKYSQQGIAHLIHDIYIYSASFEGKGLFQILLRQGPFFMSNQKNFTNETPKEFQAVIHVQKGHSKNSFTASHSTYMA